MSELNIVDPENEETSENSFPKRDMLLKGDFMDRVKMAKEGNPIAAMPTEPLRLTGTGLTIAVVPANTRDDGGATHYDPGVIVGPGGDSGIAV